MRGLPKSKKGEGSWGAQQDSKHKRDDIYIWGPSFKEGGIARRGK